MVPLGPLGRTSSRRDIPYFLPSCISSLPSFLALSSAVATKLGTPLADPDL